MIDYFEDKIRSQKKEYKNNKTLNTKKDSLYNCLILPEYLLLLHHLLRDLVW